MATLYVTTQGARVRQSSRRLIVATDEGVLQALRLRELERLVVFGRVDLTTPTIQILLERGVETTFLTRGGRLLGSLQPPGAKNVFLRVAQVQRHHDPAFRLRVGKAVVAAKIRNSRRVLQLFGQRRDEVDVSPSLRALKASAAKVESAQAVPELMGIEGSAAATYFSAYGSLFLTETRFHTRSRRPPKDPVNALLSFGYTLLTGEALGALAAEGLDPDVGFLHDLDYGRPSLALDLVEEFRQPVVDRFVLSLVNRRVLAAGDFVEQYDGGCRMSDAARARFLDFYDRMMTSEFQPLGDGALASYRKLLRTQARAMARCVLEDGEYRPFHLR